MTQFEAAAAVEDEYWQLIMAGVGTVEACRASPASRLVGASGYVRRVREDRGDTLPAQIGCGAQALETQAGHVVPPPSQESVTDILVAQFLTLGHCCPSPTRRLWATQGHYRLCRVRW
jgi:hypothetical protein